LPLPKIAAAAASPREHQPLWPARAVRNVNQLLTRVPELQMIVAADYRNTHPH
jgi:hypothetical protein